MRVLVGGSDRSLGSDHKRIEELRAFARTVGCQLAERGHTLLVESDSPSTLDYYVIEGAICSTARRPISVEVHRIEEDGQIFDKYTQSGDLDVKHRLYTLPSS